MHRAVLLAGVILLAGCAEEQPANAPAGGTIVAFADLPAEHGTNRTILVLREGGDADRVTYLADGSWLPRLAPGLEYDDATLDAIFAQTSGTYERGGLVFRIERGHVPANATEPLRPFLGGEWPAPFVPEMAPHPWYRPLVLVRASPPASTEGPPEGFEREEGAHARLGELVGAFTTAERSFVPDEVQETTAPFEAAFDGCLRGGTSVPRDVASIGDAVEVHASVTNCAPGTLWLDARACDRAYYPHVQVHGALVLPMMSVLPSTKRASAAYAVDLVCRGDERPLELAPGASTTLTRRWNGTFAACRTAERCEYRAASPADYGFVLFTPSQRETQAAGVTLVDPAGERTPFLLVKQREHVNTTGDGQLFADYGPHCAPVHYKSDPPALTIYYHDERPMLEGVVVQDWRGEGRAIGPVITTSADKLDLTFLENGSARLASPYDETMELVAIALDGADFVVNGTRLAPGDTHLERVERTVHDREGTFETTSILEFTHMGDASVVWARAGGCA